MNLMAKPRTTKMSTLLGYDAPMTSAQDLGPRERAVRTNVRRWTLVWIGCAAMAWVATIIIGYTVMRFGDSLGSADLHRRVSGDGMIVAEHAADLASVAPAAGCTE